MAELADAHGSGPCGSNTMRVQVSFPARRGRHRFGGVFCISSSIITRKGKISHSSLFPIKHFLPIMKGKKAERRLKCLRRGGVT